MPVPPLTYYVLRSLLSPSHFFFLFLPVSVLCFLFLLFFRCQFKYDLLRKAFLIRVCRTGPSAPTSSLSYCHLTPVPHSINIPHILYLGFLAYGVPSTGYYKLTSAEASSVSSSTVSLCLHQGQRIGGSWETFMK